MRLKVQENQSLERDSITNAILNTDSEGYSAALLRKKNKSNTEKRFNELQSEISELKDLVKTLIVKMNK